MRRKRTTEIKAIQSSASQDLVSGVDSVLAKNRLGQSCPINFSLTRHYDKVKLIGHQTGLAACRYAIGVTWLAASHQRPAFHTQAWMNRDCMVAPLEFVVVTNPVASPEFPYVRTVISE